MGFFDNLFGGRSPEEKEAKALAKAQAKAKREEEEAAQKALQYNELLDRALGKDKEFYSLDARSKAAIKLVLANETAKGREAWLSISRDYPNELAFALEQIGVCYHLEKDYKSALENYQAAIRVGADAGHLADNIEEAQKGLAAQN